METSVYLDNQVFCFLAIAVWIFLRMLYLAARKRKPFMNVREALFNLFVAYMIVVASLTLLPVEIGQRQFPIGESYGNIIPIIGTLRDVERGMKVDGMSHFYFGFWLKNIGGNLLMLLPFGLLLPLQSRKRIRMGRTTLLACLLSLGIEGLQVMTLFIGDNYRVFDIDDILLNTLGAWVGALLAENIPAIIEKRKKLRPERLASQQSRREA